MSWMLTALKYVLPQGPRHSFLRSHMRFSDSELEGVIVKQVETPEEALAASHIVYRAYARRGLVTGNASHKLRVTPISILPTTRTFVATVGGRYVGALSLYADGALGLPLDKIYRPEADAFRDRGERLAEVGSLAILPAFRRKGIAFLLYRMMYETAIAMGVDRIVMAVHPKVEDLYQAALLCERFGAERAYPGLSQRALAIGLHLDLRTAADRFRAAFSHLPNDTANPYHMYCGTKRTNILEGHELASHEHERIARALVSACPEVFQELPVDLRMRLRSALPAVRVTIPEIDVSTMQDLALAMVPA